MRILVVEDEHKIANAIKKGLEQEKFAVDVVYDGDDGLAMATDEEYDLVILDRMLPGEIDGVGILTAMREAPGGEDESLLLVCFRGWDVMAATPMAGCLFASTPHPGRPRLASARLARPCHLGFRLGRRRAAPVAAWTGEPSPGHAPAVYHVYHDVGSSQQHYLPLDSLPRGV